jgi:hypothetical protein
VDRYRLGSGGGAVRLIDDPALSSMPGKFRRQDQANWTRANDEYVGFRVQRHLANLQEPL